jgi:hypothetical protein
VTHLYRRLLRLYPRDVRAVYEHEIVDDLERGLRVARESGRLQSTRFLVRELTWLLFDGTAERVSTLYSHQSFRGRRLPNPGQVRPPNMSKKEWYGTL